MKYVECRHIYEQGQGKKVDELIEDGRLTTSLDKKYCDWRVPLLITDCIGQDISCVGPNSLLCPSPTEASIIYLED